MTKSRNALRENAAIQAGGGVLDCRNHIGRLWRLDQVDGLDEETLL